MDTIFTDPRDGKTYKTIRLSGKTWLAENLNFECKKSSWISRKCCWFYEDNLIYGGKYGRLYNWQSAKRIAPPGWRLPDKSEYELLLKHSGNDETEAYHDIVINGRSGFDALAGGYRRSKPYYYGCESSAYFWTASEYDKNRAWSLQIIGTSKKVFLDIEEKRTGMSIRLIKD